MLGYDFQIIYKKGMLNVVVDSLSRKDEEVEAFLCAISIIQLDWITEARDEWKKDEEVWALIQSCGKILAHLIYLVGKMIPYGKNIAYIFARIPN